jgi:hypothetical protein
LHWGRLAQVQLKHDTAKQLTALGIDTSLVTQDDDVGTSTRSWLPTRTMRRKNRDHEAYQGKLGGSAAGVGPPSFPAISVASPWYRSARCRFQACFTFAAYNAGPGNIRKARERAVSMGLDPNVWFGQVEVAAGRTISREPVVYVRNILKYYTSYKIFEAQGHGASEGAAPG